MASVLIFVGALAIQAKSSAAQPIADPWEDRVPTDVDWKLCSDLGGFLVVPVLAKQRQAAIALLQRARIVALNESETTTFVGAESSSAPKFVSSSIARLEAQKSLALDKHEGSWTGAADLKLAELHALSARTHELRPFLVRWVTRINFQDAFSIRLCGNDLVVSGASLMAGAPPVRTAIVVFLPSMPKSVTLLTGRPP